MITFSFIKTMEEFKLKKVLDYCLKFAVKGSTKIIYMVLLLFYAYRREEVPRWAKKAIIGAIAYLISPLDAIPDLTPFIGMTDDIAVLSISLVTIASYVNTEVKQKAKSQLGQIIKKTTGTEVEEIDEWLSEKS